VPTAAALEQFVAMYAARHETLRVIQGRALLALAYAALDERTRALALLTQALALAEPGGLVRTFVDLGAPMAELLAELDAQGKNSPYVGRLVAAARAADLAGDRNPPAPRGAAVQQGDRRLAGDLD
jgi:LuxR family maltose regulon positive regulatory protein